MQLQEDVSKMEERLMPAHELKPVKAICAECFRVYEKKTCLYCETCRKLRHNKKRRKVYTMKKKYIVEVCKFSGKVGKLYEVGKYGTNNMKYRCECCKRLQLKFSDRRELTTHVNIFH